MFSVVLTIRKSAKSCDAITANETPSYLEIVRNVENLSNKTLKDMVGFLGSVLLVCGQEYMRSTTDDEPPKI